MPKEKLNTYEINLHYQGEDHIKKYKGINEDRALRKALVMMAKKTMRSFPEVWNYFAYNPECLTIKQL